ncbi:site-specific integrase [Rhizorhabdus argentea]|uniref:site-specific integrase n=1 Tax=Rhizorhabdus argentea TaxID=1387174 RepID=UPI0030EEA445
MSSANCNEYMNKFSTLLNWAVREEIVTRNPARGLRVAETVAARDKRLPFSSDQLTRMFNAPLYRGCRNDQNGYAQVGPERPRRARFWIPLIALFSGMRQGEICQLLTSDIQEVDGVICFAVCADEADAKHLKTSASARLVPVHPMLIRIGFARYVAARQGAADVRLFPELMPDRYGRYSGKFSVWFARYLVSCGANAERTCFHSARHSFRDALRAARVEREVALTLGGWGTSSGSAAGAVADQYGKGFSADHLHKAISMICYPDLDLTHLYDFGDAPQRNNSGGIRFEAEIGPVGSNRPHPLF